MEKHRKDLLKIFKKNDSALSLAYYCLGEDNKFSKGTLISRGIDILHSIFEDELFYKYVNNRAYAHGDSCELVNEAHELAVKYVAHLRHVRRRRDENAISCN